ncbi:MAG: hypothetical protein Q9218_003500 [Villophora microphyllina]
MAYSCLTQRGADQPLVLQLPTNTSFLATGASNYSLGAWPSRFPWTVRVNVKIYLGSLWYGEDAPQSWWNVVQEDFDEIVRQIEHMPRGPDENLRDPESYPEFMIGGRYTIVFFNYDPPSYGVDPYIPITDAVGLMEKVKDLVFVKENDLREFLARIQDRRRGPAIMKIRWNVNPDIPKTWPEDLPYMFLWGVRIPQHGSKITSHGRGLDPPTLASDV